MWHEIISTIQRLYPEHAVIGEQAILACGDSLRATSELPSALSCVADPPYGINYRHGSRRDIAWGNDNETCVGDDRPFIPEPLLRFRDVVLWGANHYASALPNSASWLVWNKRCGRPVRSQSDAELAWTNNQQNRVVRVFDYYWTGVQARESGEPNHHVMQKPVGLMRWCLESLPTTDPIIYDPYMGSGSTGVAAAQLGLRYIGVEIEHRHYLTACRRVTDTVCNTLPL